MTPTPKLTPIIFIKTCVCGCGRKFEVNLNTLHGRRKKYYDVACKTGLATRKRQANKKPIAPRECKICGRMFTPAKMDTALYCSEYCKGVQHRASQTKNGTRRAEKKVTMKRPAYPVNATGAGSGIKDVKRSAHVVTREEQRMDLLIRATQLPGYNPRNPEPFIRMVAERARIESNGG